MAIEGVITCKLRKFHAHYLEKSLVGQEQAETMVLPGQNIAINGSVKDQNLCVKVH